MIHAIPYYFKPRYNGTRLYMQMTHFQMANKVEVGYNDAYMYIYDKTFNMIVMGYCKKDIKQCLWFYMRDK